MQLNLKQSMPSSTRCARLRGPAVVVVLTALVGAMLLEGCDDPKAKVTNNTVISSFWMIASAGGAHSLGIKSDGTLWAWGDNTYGQLGIGATSPNSCGGNPCSTKPVLVSNLTTWSNVAAGLNFSLAIQGTGATATLWAWGDNSSLQLGNNAPSAPGALVNAPTQVCDSTATGFPCAPYIVGVTAIAAGCSHAMAISGNKLFTWGDNSTGALGLGASSGPIGKPSAADSTNNYAAIAAGCGHSLGILGTGGASPAGQLNAWGNNDHGQVGDTTTTNRPGPVTVCMNAGCAAQFANASQIAAGESHSLAVSSTGALYAWGYNNRGQLGIGVTPDQTFAVQVGSATTWAQVYGGQFHSMGMQTDKTAWGWGANDVYQLAYQLPNGTHPDQPAPVQTLTSLGTVLGMALGQNHGLAASSTTAIYGWGANASGQLGNGSTTTSPNPQPLP